MKHRYVIFKSPSPFDIDTLVYVKSRICTHQEIEIELENLNANTDHCYYWSQLDTQYKPTED